MGLVEVKLDGTTSQRIMYRVADRTAATVQEIIRKHVLPLSVVHTDGGACYKTRISGSQSVAYV